MRKPTAIAIGLLLFAAATARGDALEAARNRMVDEEIVAAGVKNPRVIAAMRATPRHEFMPIGERQYAYYDMAVPIGEGQTISPPFVVAFMTEQIDPQPTDKVLEIGTGSGYQAAVLSPLAKEVYSIEIVESLGRKAARTLERLGYENVHTKIGDGFKGWPEHAPFDKIIVTCSPESVPQPLVDQLVEGGLMVVPVGKRYQQVLYRFVKKNGKLEAQPLRATLFVPMTGEAEENRQVLPDPLHPHLTNGSFEEVPNENPEDGKPLKPSGWHYQRQLTLVDSSSAARDGKRFVTFSNREPGRGSQALQGFGVDGRKVARLDLSFWVRGEDLRYGQNRRQTPAVIVTFYDENRAPCGAERVGSWLGTFDWRRQQGAARVPLQARAAIVRIGLIGGTGEISFDGLQMTGVTK
jgi:protein-L-isoaspartate(D-aspartate) O-methyltransferase